MLSLQRWTKALVIFTKKRKAKKKPAGWMQSGKEYFRSEGGDKGDSLGRKGEGRRRAEPQDGQRTARGESE